MSDISSRLAMCLKRKGLTQRDLAERLHIAPTTINGFIRGRNKLGDRTFSELCIALNITEEWLRTGEGEMERQTAAGFAEEMAQRYGLGENAAAIIEIVAKAVTELDEETSARVLDVVYAELDKRVKRKKPLLIPHDVAEAALADALAEEKSQAE